LKNTTVLPDSDEEIAKLYIDDAEEGAIGGGPVCTFKGIRIPCYCCCSPNASISSKLLTDMLRYIDSFDVFDRKDGENPLLLLDGHHSWMDLEFLEYVNDDKHLWNVNIGVPYGTHIWQVADSSQVNGLFKLKIAETKREYNALKGLQSLTMSDIVPIVNTAFDLSFRNQTNTLHAIRERGWGTSLNYCLLLDKRLSGRPKANTSTNQSTVTGETLSLTSGSGTVTDTDTFRSGPIARCTIEFNNTEAFAAEMTDKIVEDRHRQEGRKQAAEERVRQMENREQHIEIIKNLPKLSSGQLMAKGWLRMDKNVLENQRKRQQQLALQTEQRLDKKQKQDNKQHSLYQTVMEKCTQGTKLTMKDFNTLLKKCSNKGDSPMRKNKTDVILQLTKRIDRLQSYLPLVLFTTIKNHVLPDNNNVGGAVPLTGTSTNYNNDVINVNNDDDTRTGVRTSSIATGNQRLLQSLKSAEEWRLFENDNTTKLQIPSEDIVYRAPSVQNSTTFTENNISG
jgi:hypothetical protein